MRRTYTPILFLLLTACASAPLRANIYSRPRTVSVIYTKHFDIIFPKNCAQTAYILADNGDRLYEKAAEYFEFSRTFRIPVIISQDSDEFSIEYTAFPYNRIMIFNGLPAAEDADAESILLSRFFTEITRAVASETRSPFWYGVSRIFGDAVQPTALANLPYSFVEGAARISSDSEKNPAQEQAANLRLLSQARADGAFPRWIDAAGARDTHPENVLAEAAGKAFAAYMQQRWGMEKFVEFWQESGRIHFFKLAAGIFKKVYGIPLAEAWKDFEQSVPLHTLAEPEAQLLRSNRESLYRFVAARKHGVLWYDEARHEVAFLLNGKKRRLFAASGVTSMQLSADGEYLAVSYTGKKMNESLSANRTKIYSIMANTFLAGRWNMRAGTVVALADGTMAAAGIANSGGRARLEIFPTDGRNDVPYAALEFPEGAIPESIVPAADGKLLCSVRFRSETHLLAVSTEGEVLAECRMPVPAEEFKLCILPAAERPAQKGVMFTWTPPEMGMPKAAGFLTLNADGTPEAAFLSRERCSGGMNSASAFGGKMYFSAHRTDFFQLCATSFRPGGFERAELLPAGGGAEAGIFPADGGGSGSAMKIERRKEADGNGKSVTKKYLGGHEVRAYSPVPYMFRHTFIPLLPISSLDFGGYSLAPGLGLTYIAPPDALQSVTAVFSAGADLFSFQQNYPDKNFNLSAFVKTTFLPIDIFAGGLWRFDTQGHYELTALGGAQWNVPIGMPHHKLSFDAQFIWKTSTQHTVRQTGETQELDSWPALQNAFNTFNYSFGVSYSNYRQYGTSPFHQLGVETNFQIVVLYDFSDDSTVDADGKRNAAQTKFQIDLGFKVPRLLPLPSVGNWCLSLPLAVFSQWFGEDDTSISVSAEVLLAGYEIQRGIPGINLFFQRAGLSAGYDFQFVYEQHTMDADLDILNLHTFIDILKASSIDDTVFLKFEAEFTPVIGKAAASVKMTAGARVDYYLRRNKFDVSAIFKIDL